MTQDLPPFTPLPNAGAEFPKMIVPHDSHIVRPRKVQPFAPTFEKQTYDERHGVVRVIVADADEEARALAPAKAQL